MSEVFAAGEQVLLVDNRRRRHLVVLESGGQFHTHAGIVDHDDVIGRPDGSTVRTTRGARLTALRPTLAEYILEMPRGAQVIYPKDIGPILVLADVFPGARVLESGIGSGALTTALLRAVGPSGSVTGYEIRDDFADRAVRNVHRFLGTDVPLEVQVRDVYEGIDERGLDLDGADPVAGDLHDVVDPPQEPVVTLGIDLAAVTREVHPGEPPPVRAHVALGVLVDPAQHRRPGPRQHEVSAA